MILLASFIADSVCYTGCRDRNRRDLFKGMRSG
jgi:hypothetical protein